MNPRGLLTTSQEGRICWLKTITIIPTKIIITDTSNRFNIDLSLTFKSINSFSWKLK